MPSDFCPTLALRWLGLIVWESTTKAQADKCYTELVSWVNEQNSQHRLALLTWLERVWEQRARLLHCLRSGSPAPALKGTWNESYHNSLKSAIGKGRAGSLALLAHALGRVAAGKVGDARLSSCII
jgi:hypothetical protein